MRYNLWGGIVAAMQDCCTGVREPVVSNGHSVQNMVKYTNGEKEA